jgi:superfamily II DNA/RNA helicase
VSVAERLTEEGFPARYISGGQAQDERLATMQLFRDFRIRVLVSTDLVPSSLSS